MILVVYCITIERLLHDSTVVVFTWYLSHLPTFFFENIRLGMNDDLKQTLEELKAKYRDDTDTYRNSLRELQTKLKATKAR